MTQATIFDAIAGRQLGHEGAERAADHAEAVAPEWRHQAGDFFRGWLLTKGPNEEFAVEDCWRAAEEAGVPAPPDRRAWGAITRRFGPNGREPLMQPTGGYRPASNVRAHAGDVKLWRRIV